MLENEENLSTDFIRAGMSGFLWANQQNLLEPYMSLHPCMMKNHK